MAKAALYTLSGLGLLVKSPHTCTGKIDLIIVFSPGSYRIFSLLGPLGSPPCLNVVSANSKYLRPSGIREYCRGVIDAQLVECTGYMTAEILAELSNYVLKI
jgi:hypothetical protein